MCNFETVLHSLASVMVRLELGMLIESRVPGSKKNYPIPGSPLPEGILGATVKWKFAAN